MGIRAIATFVLLFACGTAAAHVTVWPRESQTGSYEKYVVRVPTEGNVATTSLELVVPDDVTIVSLGAPAGFTYEVKRAGDRITTIIWTMRIAPGEFAEFAFMARNPKAAGDIAWRAVQRFADGTQTEWSGPRGDKHPASMTVVKAADASAGHGSH